MSYFKKNGSDKKRESLCDSYNDIDTLQRLKVILKWAKIVKLKKHGITINFDSETMEGILEYYEEYEHFTTNQINAISNVYSKFKIDEWFKYNK